MPHTGTRPEGWHRQEVATLARALQLDMDSLEQAQAARVMRDRCAEGSSAACLGKAVRDLTVAHRQQQQARQQRARDLASCCCCALFCRSRDGFVCLFVHRLLARAWEPPPVSFAYPCHLPKHMTHNPTPHPPVPPTHAGGCALRATTCSAQRMRQRWLGSRHAWTKLRWQRGGPSPPGCC